MRFTSSGFQRSLLSFLNVGPGLFSASRESGWLSGYQQCLPPLWPGFNSRPRDRMWLEFQSISTWLRGFFSGYSGFPPSAKSTHSLFHQAVLLCSEVIHGSCSGAERLAGSTAPSVRSCWAAPLAIQSPTARKGDQQVTYYYYLFYDLQVTSWRCGGRWSFFYLYQGLGTPMQIKR